MTKIKTYEMFSDEELLKEVFLADTVTTLEMELAKRLEHALDELAKAPMKIDQYVEGLHGNDS